MSVTRYCSDLVIISPHQYQMSPVRFWFRSWRIRAWILILSYVLGELKPSIKLIIKGLMDWKQTCHFNRYSRWNYSCICFVSDKSKYQSTFIDGCTYNFKTCWTPWSSSTTTTTAATTTTTTTDISLNILMLVRLLLKPVSMSTHNTTLLLLLLLSYSQTLLIYRSFYFIIKYQSKY